MTSEQRRDLWNQMSPEQREQWRNARISGEQQRGGVDQPRTDAVTSRPRSVKPMRQRFYERQQGSQMPGAERSAPQRRQLSPEERQLRQQIRGPTKHLPACRRRQQRRQQMRRFLGGLIVLVLASSGPAMATADATRSTGREAAVDARRLCTQRRRGGCLQRADARSRG